MRTFLKIIPPGTLLTLFIAAASVSPKDAVSNLAKWVAIFGPSNFPTWFAYKGVDYVGLAISIIISVMYILVIWKRKVVELFDVSHHLKKEIGPIAIARITALGSILIAVVFASYVFWVHNNVQACGHVSIIGSTFHNIGQDAINVPSCIDLNVVNPTMENIGRDGIHIRKNGE